MATGPLQPRNMAKTVRAKMAGRGWTRPCRLRGSGTSAKTSIRERPAMTGLRSGRARLPPLLIPSLSANSNRRIALHAARQFAAPAFWLPPPMWGREKTQAALSRAGTAIAIGWSGLLLLAVEQGALPLQPPAVAAQSAVLADDAMTRNDDRYRIGRAGPGDSAGRRRLAERLGDLAVGARAAGRDRLQLLPDAPLEGRCLDVQGQLEVWLLTAKVIEQLLQPGPQRVVVALDCRRGILLEERLLQDGVAVAEVDGGDAALGRRQEQTTQRAVRQRVAQTHALAAAAVLARGHTELGRRPLVETAARTITDFVEGSCHCLCPPIAQPRLELAQAAGVGVLARRDAHDPSKPALEMRRAEARLFAEHRERQRFFQMFLDVGADLPHQPNVRAPIRVVVQSRRHSFVRSPHRCTSEGRIPRPGGKHLSGSCAEIFFNPAAPCP